MNLQHGVLDGVKYTRVAPTLIGRVSLAQTGSTMRYLELIIRLTLQLHK